LWYSGFPLTILDAEFRERITAGIFPVQPKQELLVLLGLSQTKHHSFGQTIFRVLEAGVEWIRAHYLKMQSKCRHKPLKTNKTNKPLSIPRKERYWKP
jgi:hypothetical protein